MHHQAALYLCKKFQTILIPEFGTQNMIQDKSKFKNKYKSNIKEIMDKKENKEELKKYNRKSRLNKRVKFVLQQIH